MPYLRNQPVATDDVSVSQPILAANTNQADDSFGIDHYKFSDLTVNNGKHNQVTTPAFVANPPTGLPPTTLAAEPKFYAFQDSANLGVIQYSRGPLNAVPTPLTHLHSTAAALVVAPGGTTNVFDFTGLAFALCMLYTSDIAVTGTNKVAYVVFTGSSLSISTLNPSAALTIQATGNILQIKNTTAPPVAYNNLYWTLDILRSS